MSDEIKSMDVQLICKQRVVNYDTFEVLNQWTLVNLGTTLLILLPCSQ